MVKIYGRCWITQLGWSNAEKLFIHNNHIDILSITEFQEVNVEPIKYHAMALDAMYKTNKLVPLEKSYTWRIAHNMKPLLDDLSTVPKIIANLRGDEYHIDLVKHTLRKQAGNCEAMATVCAFFLGSDPNFQGKITKVTYLDHAFLEVTLSNASQFYVDPWSEKIYLNKNDIMGYKQASNELERVIIGATEIKLNKGVNLIKWMDGAVLAFGVPGHKLDKDSNWFKANKQFD